MPERTGSEVGAVFTLYGATSFSVHTVCLMRRQQRAAILAAIDRQVCSVDPTHLYRHQRQVPLFARLSC